MLYFEYYEAFVFFALYFLTLFKKRDGIYFSRFNLYSFSIFKPSLLKHLAFISFIIALSSPLYIDKKEPNNHIGKNIAIAIDVSSSMARDNKIEITKTLVSEFISKRESDNISLTLFSDSSKLLSPLTFDNEMLLKLIDRIKISGENTALFDGILRAISSLDSQNSIVLLFSDGEDNTGKILPNELLNFISQNSIKIYVLSLSKSSSELLELIATESGGAYFEAKDEKSIYKAISQIDFLESENIRVRDFKVKESLFIYPLSFGFWCLSLYLLFRGSV